MVVDLLAVSSWERAVVWLPAAVVGIGLVAAVLILLGRAFMVTVRESGHPRWVLGPAGRRTASPPTRESHAHWVAALGGGERLAAWTIECQGEYVAAAAAVTVFAAALSGRAARRPGVHLPEDVFTLDELAPALWGAGIDLVHHRL